MEKRNAFPIVTKHAIISPKNPNAPWEDKWDISVRKRDVKIGELSCAGSPVHGYIEFEVELDPEYAKVKYYYREIYEAMAHFLFRIKEVQEVGCKCPYMDYLRREALDKTPYVRRERDSEDVLRYSITRQKTGWTGLYILIGFVTGIAVGALLNNMWIGTAIGVVGGGLLGLRQDLAGREKK